MPKSLLTLLAAAGIALTGSGSVTAQDGPQTVTIIIHRQVSYTEEHVNVLNPPLLYRDFLEKVRQEGPLDLRIQVSVPFARALRQVETSPEPLCLARVTFTPDRAGLFKFTDPVSRLGQLVVQTRPEIAARHSTLDSLLRDPSLELLARQGTTMGAGIDQILKKAGTRVRTLAGTDSDMTDMVCGGRADYNFSGSASVVDSCPPGSPTTLTNVTYPDAPELQPERIACSLSTPDDVIAIFNRLLRKSRSGSDAISG
jgi:hypothetical protein